MENEIGPQVSMRTIEETRAEAVQTQGDAIWEWNIGIDNITDLLRYLDASGVSVREFLQFNLYKKNVGKVGWLRELEQHQ